MHSEALAVNISEAARRLSLAPRTAATLVSRRELFSQKVGCRRIIPVTALEEFVTRNRVGGNGPALRDAQIESDR